jgi:predicted Zn-dependent peptidase
MGDIQTWSIDDIKNFHATYYQPKNAIVIVSGDVEANEIFDIASKHFKDINNTIDKIPSVHTKEPKQMGAKRVEIEKENGTQIVAIAYHIPNFAHKDQVALSVISGILSDGGSSRLVSELVDKKKLVNSIYAYNMENTDAGVFLFMAMCNVGIEAEVVEKELLIQIEKLKTELVSKEELEKIKINTKADFIYSMENSSNVSSLFGGYLARGDMEPLLSYEQRLGKLEAKEILEVAKEYFIKNNSTTVILKSPIIKEKEENVKEKEEKQ